MLKSRRIKYNAYFMYPFLVWIAAGGILLKLYDKEQMFRMINGHNSAIADSAMYYITQIGEGNLIVGVLALLMLIPKFRTWQYFFTATLCNIVPFLVQQGLKSYFNHPRPFNYFHNAPWIHYLYKWPYLSERSFPSGHSEGALSFLCFLSFLLPPKYGKLGFVFFCMGISVCYSRVYLTAHFYEDVYIGSIIGGVMTTIIFMAMDQYKERLFKKTDTFI